MEVTFSVQVLGYRRKRNTQSIALNLEPYSNSIWLFDVGEGTQHQILRHSIKLGKIDHIFITHMVIIFWSPWTFNKSFVSRWRK